MPLLFTESETNAARLLRDTQPTFFCQNMLEMPAFHPVPGSTHVVISLTSLRNLA